eukprot:10581757-Ditylum_brightwellii.AAC.1
MSSQSTSTMTDATSTTTAMKFDIKEIHKKTPMKLTLERFEYTRKNILRNGTNVYTCTYWSWRKEMEQCKAKLIYSWVEGGVIGIEELYLHKCCFKNSIGSPEDEGIKVKEESTIGIGKENIDPNILLTDSASNAPMKVSKPKTIDAYIKIETLTDSTCTSQRIILPSKAWEQVKTSLDDRYGGKGWDGHQKHYITKRVNIQENFSGDLS